MCHQRILLAHLITVTCVFAFFLSDTYGPRESEFCCVTNAPNNMICIRASLLLMPPINEDVCVSLQASKYQHEFHPQFFTVGLT